ncbi:MAG: hypothetical protein LBT86_06845 [Deltaproteobacteria bacterium]|jgi:hypothetical protein|nr:hypothetical protein [Deltaproteobacteria bacterium]
MEDETRNEYQRAIMDTQIFLLGISVEAKSAYILICSMVEDGRNPDWASLRAAWVGEPAALEPAVAELLAWSVIMVAIDAFGQERFAVNPGSLWLPPGTEEN